MGIRRRDFLTGTSALAAISAAGAGWVAGSVWGSQSLLPKHKRPNIIVLLADDMRADSMGWTGNRVVRTPYLDQLAAQSLCFRNHFVTTSICPTSRASILMGRYGSLHGVWGFDYPLPRPLLALSFPLLLRQAGYRTGFIGKWGLGDYSTHPTDAFDVWQGIPDNMSYHVEGTTQHLTDLQAQQAKRFLESQDNTPFLMMVSFRAPHAPYEAATRFADTYSTQQIPPPPTMNPAAFASRPELVREHTLNVHEDAPFHRMEDYQNYVKGYYRLVTGLDSAVGQILAQLDQLGLSDNTCVLFSSDNGLMMGEFMLGSKTFGYEPSIRTPLLMRLPQSLYPMFVSRSVDALTLNVDIAPTILELAGVYPAPPMHGRSLMPLAFSDHTPWRSEFAYEQYHSRWGLPRCDGLRTQTSKMMRYFKDKRVDKELYNLVTDPLEETNLALDPTYTESFHKMRQRFAALTEDIRALKQV